MLAKLISNPFKVHALFAELGCATADVAALPSISRARTPSQATVIAQLRGTSAAQQRDEAGRPAALNLSLTRSACEATKDLYAVDARLHRERCGPHAVWDS